MKPSVIITGGTSGIGKALALTYGAQNYEVFTLSRRDTCWDVPHIHHFSCDVTSEEDLSRVYTALSRQKHSSITLICCAGYGIAGATEDTSLQEAKSQFDVNFFGVFLTIRAFLPLLKKYNNSKIIVISSAAGELSIPFQSFYSASKAAVNKLLEAWQAELKPYRIQITSFLLGDIKTEFTQNRLRTRKISEEYRIRLERSLKKMEQDEIHGMNASLIAKSIYQRCRHKHLQPVQTIGWQYHLFLLLQRILPRKLILTLIGFLYA